MNQSTMFFIVSLSFFLLQSPHFLKGANETTFLQDSLNVVKTLEVCKGDVSLLLVLMDNQKKNHSTSTPINSDAYNSYLSLLEGEGSLGGAIQSFTINNDNDNYTFSKLWMSNLTFSSCIVIAIPEHHDESHLQLKQIIKQISLDLQNLLVSSNLLPSIIILKGWVEENQALFMAQAFNNTPAPFDIRGSMYTLFLSPQKEFSLWEVYNVKERRMIGKVVEGKIGDCYYSLLGTKISRRSNFQGERFVGILRENQPYTATYEVDPETGNVTLLGGFSVELFWNFQKMLNISIGTVFGDGVKTLRNRTLVGTTMSLLRSGEADVYLSTSSLVPVRAASVSFLQPSYYGIIYCFFKQPSINSVRNIVTGQFDKYVWATVLITWILIMSLVKAGIHMRRRKRNIDKRKQDKKEESWELMNLKHELNMTKLMNLNENNDDNDAKFASQVGIWVFAANCQKSLNAVPDSYIMRLIFLIGILCGLLSYIAYSGAITSTLTIQIVPVNDLDDLIRYKYTFTVHRESSPFRDFLQAMITREDLKQRVLTVSTEEEISHLLDKKRPKAFLTYSDLFYPTALTLGYNETFICSQIFKLEVTPERQKSGMFMMKGSPYREMFNHKLIIQKERGFNYRFQHNYDINNVFTCEYSHNTVDPIEFNDVWTAFLLICSGMGYSVVLLIVEILHKRLTSWSEKWKRTNQNEVVESGGIPEYTRPSQPYNTMN